MEIDRAPPAARSIAANTPLQRLFAKRRVAQPNASFPCIGYTFERVRAFADFIPAGGGFDQPGALPDQAKIVQCRRVAVQGDAPELSAESLFARQPRSCAKALTYKTPFTTSPLVGIRWRRSI